MNVTRIDLRLVFIIVRMVTNTEDGWNKFNLVCRISQDILIVVCLELSGIIFMQLGTNVIHICE